MSGTFEGKPIRGRFTQMLEEERGGFLQPLHQTNVSENPKALARTTRRGKMSS